MNADIIKQLRGYQDPLLTKWARGFTNETFVSDFILPEVSVSKSTGKYPILGREGLKTFDSTDFNIGGQVAQMPRDAITYGTYNIEWNGLETPLDFREIQTGQQELNINLPKHYLKACDDSLKLQKEIATILMLSTSTNYETANVTALTGTACFDDASSTPILTIQNSMEAVYTYTGKYPNRLVIGPDAWIALRNHAGVLGLIKYSQTAIFTIPLLEQMLSTPENKVKVRIGTGFKESSSTAGTNTKLWSDQIVMAYVGPNVEKDIYTPSFGKTLKLKGAPIGYKDPKSKFVEASGILRADQSIISFKGAGALITNCKGS